jgi:hypothetical protein
VKKILLIVLILLLTGCSSYDPTSSGTDNQPIPKTKTVCDLLGAGLFAGSVIEEQLAQGYEFTGSTKGLICVNVLHFQLIEKGD